MLFHGPLTPQRKKCVTGRTRRAMPRGAGQTTQHTSTSRRCLFLGVFCCRYSLALHHLVRRSAEWDRQSRRKKRKMLRRSNDTEKTRLMGMGERSLPKDSPWKTQELDPLSLSLKCYVHMQACTHIKCRLRAVRVSCVPV